MEEIKLNWTVKDVADFLNVCVATVTNSLIPDKGLPAYKVGGQFRFKEAEVKNWLSKQKINDYN